MERYNNRQLRKFFQDKHPVIPNRIVITTNGNYAMDLKTDMPSDGGFKHFLVLINQKTRHIFTAPLKTKTAAETEEVLKNLIKFNRNKVSQIDRIHCDKGSEFHNSRMRSFLESRFVELIGENPYHKNSTAIVERAIGTLTKSILTDLNISYLNSKKKSTAWVSLLATYTAHMNDAAAARTDLNEQGSVAQENPLIHKSVIPIGTVVFIRLAKPKHIDAQTNKFRFRNGDLRYDTHEHVVTGYKLRHGKPLTYYLDDDKTISYNAHELLSHNELLSVD